MRVAGIGFRQTATVASLRDALARAVGDGPPVQYLATAQQKAGAPAFRDLAAALSIPCISVDTADLEAITTPTYSAQVHDQFGTGSLAEAAALAAAGPDAKLRVARVVSGDKMATAAIAENEDI